MEKIERKELKKRYLKFAGDDRCIAFISDGEGDESNLYLDDIFEDVEEELLDFISQELDRAREEGFRIMFEGLDNIARNSSEDFYEGVAIIKLRNEITRLYKLKTKEDGK